MEKELKNILPILGIEHDCILSKQGEYTVAYRVQLPEIFTLSDEDYENMHQAWVKAIRVLPKDSVLHKQDWFTRQSVKTDEEKKHSFLSAAANHHFAGRLFLQHDCLLYFTKKPAGRSKSSSLFSTLLRPTLVPKETLQAQARQEFLDTCTQFKRLLEDTRLMTLTRLTSADLQSQLKKTGLIERYCFVSEDDGQLLIKDISLSDSIRIGSQQLAVYTLGDAEQLPAQCGSRLTYDAYSTDQTRFPVSFAAGLGLLLDCSHIYNQYILIGDAQATLRQLEKKRLRLQSLSAYSRENAISLEATNDFLNEAISQQRLPVKAHCNVMIWSADENKLKESGNKVVSALAAMDAAGKPETDGAAQIWWAGIPGNGGDFPLNDTFDTFAEQAACFLNLESNYRSDPPGEGIRFCDRLNAKPVYADLYDAPRHNGITSNMGTLVCGTSGGGKSMTVNHILRSLYDQGAHCVTVDIGGSYKGLCGLLGGYYFTYKEHNPIKFNPFYLGKGDVLDTEKKESLKALLVSLWKGENETFNRAEYVALSNALQGYYEHLAKNNRLFPGFNSFYDYLEADYRQVLQSHRVKERDFDMDNFLYVLRPYYKGGEFDFLLNATENLELLSQPFVVFELDQIKDHPILFPVCTLIITELFISKMRKLPGLRKVLTIDEAWKAIAKSGMAEFLRYAFKTIRKFNGIPIVITQELDDLINSPVIKDAIINNADIKILMDMRKFQGKFGKLQDALGLSDKSKTILLSVNKDNREIFIDIGGQVMKVYKNELCPEEYYAFTTEGRERVKVLKYAEKHGSIEAGIKALVAEKRNSKAA
ncbi:TraG family conjugative transposon ATPase [Mucilaginibacter sp. AK015]|uniref:TraG family conjugative transposon ATPase n=1 Tax=Mucilaginibacter sp. AK015 TaxID=2723072 RepID=UPI0016167552|nr:TraG family conjugative transposon ATPase [Mucilaginibacter sp. AK015]MBB5396660.1 conjugation system TraG family ATPase [Mucilaginibacter sp. AK015]